MVYRNITASGALWGAVHVLEYAVHVLIQYMYFQPGFWAQYDI